ncbi:MAG: ABC transporter permease, partial [Acidobacteriota bacterium]|nr:ABC transporter permease [Acidobacteriota bacterium]
MIGAIAKFEIKYHLKSPVFYILTGIFALLAFFAVASEGVQLGGAIGNVHRNSPYVTMQMLLVMSIFGVLSTTAFVANSVHRDFDIGIDPLFFTAPIKKYQYLAGRFLGSYFVALLLFAGVTLAILLGSFAPWLDPQVLGPVSLKPYLFSLVFIIAPTLFLVGAVFFSIAALTRSLMYTYAGNVGFIVAWAISRALLRDIENEKLSVLLDPFGFAAYAFTTRYWTVFEKNTRLLPLGGPFLLSRMLWIGIALAVLALAFWKFNFAAATRKAQKKRTKVETELPMQASFRLPQVQQTFGGAASWRKYLAATKLEAGTILK